MKDPREVILDFIARFKGSEEVFLHGCCYWFARILEERFYSHPGAEIKYEPVEGHFITKIDYRYYDVRGDVTECYRGKPMYDLYELHRDHCKYYDHLMRDCRDFAEDEDEKNTDVFALLKAQDPINPERSGKGTYWYYCCGNCGQPLDPGDPFCRKCGRAVKWE